MNRRYFIKRGSLLVPAIFIPKVIKAQDLRSQMLRVKAWQKSNQTAGGSYTPTATKFDGSTNWLSHSADLTGASNSNFLTGSFWLKQNSAAQDGTVRYIYRDGGDLILIHLDTDNTMFFLGNDPTFTTILRARTAATFLASSTWRHIAYSFDMANTGNRSIYIDGSLDSTTWTTYTNANLFYANGGDIGIFATATGSGKNSCSVSEFYLNTAAYIDLSANLTKFRSAGGHPVNLGASGATPTGSQPILYLKNGFATFQNNLGSGGNFTANGTLQDDPAIP